MTYPKKVHHGIRETRHEFEERGVHRRAGVSHFIQRSCGGFSVGKGDLLPAVCYLLELPATCYLQIRKCANDASGARALCARLQYSDNRPCLNVVMLRAWPEPICNGSRSYPAPCRQQVAGSSGRWQIAGSENNSVPGALISQPSPHSIATEWRISPLLSPGSR